MTEGLADISGHPTPELERLYGIWSDGGAGLLLSGNIQIDANHLERPGNVIIERMPEHEGEGAILREALSRWAKAATRQGNHFWAQISHSGRQTMKNINTHPKAPSAVKVRLPGGQFGSPEALTEAEIYDLIGRFGQAALACQETGFTGVQIHAAHGYLISQFLSPNTNQRDDQWGGSLENRARFLLYVLNSVRALVGPEFPIAVKLNSADFQRGGFAFDDSIQVAKWLQDGGVDLIEISGGTYEQPKLLGIEGIESPEEQGVAETTIAREAYFVDFARAMHEHVKVPLLVTGGFRSRSAMEQAIRSGSADMVGIGRPLCHQTDAIKRMLNGTQMLPAMERHLKLLPDRLSWLKRFKTVRAMDSFAVQYWYYAQLYALGRTGKPAIDRTVFQAMREVEAVHKKWLEDRRRG